MTWNERILAAKQIGYFTEADKEAAGEWPTDPCGERVATMPERKRSWIVRQAGGAPYDDDLKRFCWEFQDAVDRDEPYLAGELLELIHRKIDELAEKIA